MVQKCADKKKLGDTIGYRNTQKRTCVGTWKVNFHVYCCEGVNNDPYEIFKDCIKTEKNIAALFTKHRQLFSLLTMITIDDVIFGNFRGNGRLLSLTIRNQLARGRNSSIDGPWKRILALWDFPLASNPNPFA